LQKNAQAVAIRMVTGHISVNVYFMTVGKKFATKVNMGNRPTIFKSPRKPQVGATDMTKLENCVFIRKLRREVGQIVCSYNLKVYLDTFFPLSFCLAPWAKMAGGDIYLKNY
jgi:hypothetical protein